MSGYIFGNSMASYDSYGYQVDRPYNERNYYGCYNPDRGYDSYTNTYNLGRSDQSSFSYRSSYVPQDYSSYNRRQPSYPRKPHNKPQHNHSDSCMLSNDIVELFEATQSMIELDIRRYEKMVPLNSPLISTVKGLLDYFIESVDYYVANMRKRGDDHSRWMAEEMLDRGMKTVLQAQSLLRRSCIEDEDDVNITEVVTGGPNANDKRLVDSTLSEEEVHPIINTTLEQSDAQEEECGKIHQCPEEFGGEEIVHMDDNHLKNFQLGQSHMEKDIEVIYDSSLCFKEASFSLDFFVINTDVEHPNPVTTVLGMYFFKIPRAIVQLISYEGEMDSSFSEYSLKNHERKTYPFDTG